MSARVALSWTFLTAVLLAVVAACGQEAGSEVAGESADGEALYVMHCAACHGEEGVGTESGPPLVHIVYEPGHHDDESFHRAVRDGVVPHHWGFGPMPPLTGVAEEQVDEIIAYVRALQRDAGIE
jgi:mono/diheme cytochrome c family protein